MKGWESRGSVNGIEGKGNMKCEGKKILGRERRGVLDEPQEAEETWSDVEGSRRGTVKQYAFLVRNKQVIGVHDGKTVKIRHNHFVILNLFFCISTETSIEK